METTINIDNYLTEEEQKDIIISEFKNVVRRMICKNGDNGVEKQIERILGNCALHTITEMFNQHYNSDIENIIIRHVDKVLADGSLTYHIFHKKDVWGNDDSIGTKIIEKAVLNNKDVIEQRVTECIENYNISESLENVIVSAIENRISSLDSILEVMLKNKKMNKDVYTHD